MITYEPYQPVLPKWVKRGARIVAAVIVAISLGSLAWLLVMIGDEFGWVQGTTEPTIAVLIDQKNVPELAARTLSVIEIVHGKKWLSYALILDNGETYPVMPDDAGQLKHQVLIETLLNFPDKVHRIRVLNLPCKKDETPVYY